MARHGSAWRRSGVVFCGDNAYRSADTFQGCATGFGTDTGTASGTCIPHRTTAMSHLLGVEVMRCPATGTCAMLRTYTESGCGALVSCTGDGRVYSRPHRCHQVEAHEDRTLNALQAPVCAPRRTGWSLAWTFGTLVA